MDTLDVFLDEFGKGLGALEIVRGEFFSHFFEDEVGFEEAGGGTLLHTFYNGFLGNFTTLEIIFEIILKYLRLIRIIASYYLLIK